MTFMNLQGFQLTKYVKINIIKLYRTKNMSNLQNNLKKITKSTYIMFTKPKKSGIIIISEGTKER